MADAPLISINIENWKKRLGAYAAESGKNMREALYEEWPFLMEKIISFTPPKTLAQGRAATGRDIEKTMRPFDPSSIRMRGIREIVAKKDIQAFNIVAARSKRAPLQNARAVGFSLEVHTSQRNALGRVGRDLNQVVLGTDASLLKKYKKSVQDRVGWAKAGWLKAYALVGGTNAPSFVTRHGMGGGDVIDNHASETDPSITAINRTPWAVRKDEGQRIIRSAYFSRSQALMGKILTKLKLAKRDAQFGSAA